MMEKVAFVPILIFVGLEIASQGETRVMPPNVLRWSALREMVIEACRERLRRYDESVGE